MQTKRTYLKRIRVGDSVRYGDCVAIIENIREGSIDLAVDHPPKLAVCVEQRLAKGSQKSVESAAETS